MKMMFLAGLMITFPAIAVVLVTFGSAAMIPALVSLTINFLPFLIAAFLLRNSDLGGH